MAALSTDADERLSPYDGLVYQPRRLMDGQSPHAVALAALARNGRLAIYAGAGLSRAQPTELPSGAEVARRTYTRLATLFPSMPACAENDLTSVADSVASVAGGLSALRETVVHVAEFTSATPNYGHKVLAFLLLEGAVNVMTTNWDDCIERGGLPERLQVTITAQERVQVTVRTLLKVHGCASRPPTLLMTSAEVDAPPNWVRIEIGARLTDSHVVFVGIGDVAAYVRLRISEAVAAVGGADHVRVVSPTISTDWANTEWASVLPTLAEEHRIEMFADEFLDMLAGAYIRQFLLDMDIALADNVPLQAALQTVVQPLEQLDALAVLEWLRSIAVPRNTGVSVLASEHTARVLVALGILAAGVLVMQKGGAARTPTQRFQLLVALGLQSASRMRREADNRLAAFLADGGHPDEQPTFLISCPFPQTAPLATLPGDLVGTAPSDDVLSGPLNVSAVLMNAAEVIGG